jgi:hypothetical protein
MWVQLFSVVMAIAVGFAVAAVMLEGQTGKKPRRARISAYR